MSPINVTADIVMEGSGFLQFDLEPDHEAAYQAATTDAERYAVIEAAVREAATSDDITDSEIDVTHAFAETREGQ